MFYVERFSHDCTQKLADFTGTPSLLEGRERKGKREIVHGPEDISRPWP
jgi:hypothetical protein